jgi:hypothetical protein
MKYMHHARKSFDWQTSKQHFISYVVNPYKTNNNGHKKLIQANGPQICKPDAFVGLYLRKLMDKIKCTSDRVDKVTKQLVLQM